IGDLHGDAAASHIDLADLAACAVDDVGLPVVAPGDDAVADRVRATSGGQLLLADAAIVMHALAGERVELGNVDAAVGDHDGVPGSIAGGGPPVLDERLARLGGGRPGHE